MTNDLFGLEGQLLEGKYAIERPVAEGGFGVVYKALHRTLNKPVALKVLKLPADFSPTAREAFMQGFSIEAQTIARLEHPAVVKVLDFGVSEMPSGGTAPWMVLEWLTGIPLEDELKMRRGHGGRAPQACFEMLRPIIEAVAVAHDAGVAHRDIKPANVMILGAPENPMGTLSGQSRRGGPQLRLLDFGIAKVMRPDETGSSGQTRTQSALLAFSLPYAAPEQISATRTGPWTDVHALALVLFEMLTDMRAYDGNDSMEVHLQVLANVRPTPAKVGLDVGAWEPVLQRALAVRPSERYQHAGELLDALDKALPGATHRPLAGHPVAVAGSTQVSAPPQAPMQVSTLTPVENPAFSARSRRAPVLIGAAIATVVVGLLAAGAYALLQPDRASASNAAPERPPAHSAALAAAPPAQPPAPPAAPAPAAPVRPVAESPAAPPAPVAVAVEETGHRSRRSRRRRDRDDATGGSAPTVIAAPQAPTGFRNVGVE